MVSRQKEQTLTQFAFACAAVYGLSYGLASPTLAAISHTFGLSYAQAGLFASALTLGLPLTSLAGGIMADRWGLQRLLLSGLAGFALALTIISVAPLYSLVLAGAGLIGLAAGLVEVNLATLVTRHKTGPATAALSQLYVFTGLGALVSPLYAGTILDAGGSWRVSYAATAFLCAAVFGLASRIPIASSQPATDTSTHARTIFKLLRRRPMILGLLAVFIYGGTQWGLISWLATYLEQVRNFSPFWASVAVSTVWGAEMVSRYIYGRLQMQCSERALVLGTTGVGVLALLAALALPSVPLVLTALALGSLALGPLWPALIANIGQIEDEYLATATGLAMTCASIGTIVAPILIGVVATQVGLSEAAYITVLALALLIPLFLPE